MTEEFYPVSPVTIGVSMADLRTMQRLVRVLDRLSHAPTYLDRVTPELPASARFNPGHAAVMMCYDFHLSDAGPRLIEINTNAGGGYYALLSEEQADDNRSFRAERLAARLLRSFLDEWAAFAPGGAPLKSVVIVDETPEKQPLYAEMKAFCSWLNAQGIKAQILAPEQLTADASGVSYGGEKIDFVYNRHCDFYLEEDELNGLRQAYLAGTVCLSPNPRSYGLLADKRRMILWSDEEALETFDLRSHEQALLLETVPRSRLLAQGALDSFWKERKKLIFKPVARFGGRGVLPGKGISRTRFDELDPDTTLVQELVPPSVVTDAEGRKLKVDLRLFTYRNRMIGIVARVYQGQVTNLRSEGGGFARVRIVRS
ncbi:MAG: hypothetical protein C0622_09455 [Desulfuromonas sp.]|nr:MAG: hypothetical protein C0622_09455 [Desulfuromonas sp.]